MGKHLNKYKEQLGLNHKEEKLDINKNKDFKKLVERVTVLEEGLQDIFDKLSGLEKAKNNKNNKNQQSQ